MVGASFALVLALWPQSAGAAQRPADATSTITGTPSYVVGPGDVLDVTVLDQADLSRSTTVQPDGRMTMGLIGDIEVAGKTVAAIREMITERLARDFLVNPQVEVRVREYASQFVLVVGEVMNPGRRALRGNSRLIDVLLESGGFKGGASGEVLVQRTQGTLPDGTKMLRVRPGAGAAMNDADRSSLELVLRNGDVITAAPKYYVTIDGEVNRPGRVMIENDLTLLGVIADAGGLAKYGSSKVRIIRRKEEGAAALAGFEPCEGSAQDLCLVVEVKDVRKGKVHDVVMMPNDKVVVSRRRF